MRDGRKVDRGRDGGRERQRQNWAWWEERGGNGGREYFTVAAWEHKALLSIHHFNTNWVFACVLPLNVVCECVWLYKRMFVHVFEFVFDRCTYWQRFKEVFLLRLSLICPAGYRALFKGYYTADLWPSQRFSQRLKSLRAVTLTILSLFRCLCKEIISLQVGTGLTPDSWQWQKALLLRCSHMFPAYASMPVKTGLSYSLWDHPFTEGAFTTPIPN